MLAQRFNIRRILLLHGALLLAVIGTAYLSVRAQYQTLSDQALFDAQADLELITHGAADAVQQQLRLIVAGLWDLDFTQETNQRLPDGYVAALVTLDRHTGVVATHEWGEAPAINAGVAQAKWLATVDRPALALVTLNDQCRVLLAVPMRGGLRTAVALISPQQMAADLTAAAPRENVPPICLTDASGRVLAATAGPAMPQWLQTTLSPALQDRLNTSLKVGASLKSSSSGNSFVDPGNDGTGDDTAKIMAIRALEPINNVSWHVVAVRTDVRRAINRRLRPVFWQLISLSILMVLATTVVMLSTTISLRRGSRRIERLRMQMLDRDLQKARTIQLNWLPAPVLHAPHLSIAAENRPASHISGDFYNWFELPAGEDDGVRKTVVVIGDVSGHGLPAAFLMATAQLLVRNTMPTVRDPGACLGEVNRQLCSLVYNGQFVTMMILVIDHELTGIEVASAGQGPPLLRRGGVVSEMEIESQLVAGVDRSVEYPTHRVRIRPGDLLMLYTDGAIESACQTGQQFGLTRLGEVIRTAGDNPEAVVAAASAALVAYCGDDEFDDDLTLVAIQLAAEANLPREGGHVPARGGLISTPVSPRES